MIIIPTLFRKLQTVKGLVRPLSRKHCFGTPFDSQHVKGPKLLQNLHESTFIIFYITLREPGVENFSFSDILNLRVG